MPNFTRTVEFIALVCVGFAVSSHDSLALPPPQTLNFDFGDGPAHVGDDGVLSSPGGTYWNRVTAADLNGSSSSGLGGTLQTLDEFGNTTAGEVFSPGPDPFSFPTIAGWEDPFGADFIFYSVIPISDSLRPSGNDGDDALLYLFRVEKFEEMIIYFNTSLPSGGLVNWQNPDMISTNFLEFTMQSHPFNDQLSVPYIRITEPPPRPGLLGAGRTIALSVPISGGNFPSTAITAIQIRGAFGLPEPTSVGLLCVGIVCSMSRSRRVAKVKLASRNSPLPCPLATGL